MLGLWNHTYDFLRKLNRSLTDGGFVSGGRGSIGVDVRADNLAEFQKWTEGRVIYNNFELSRLSLWKSSLWRGFMKSVDLSGKVYTHRWGDAPLHTIFVLLGLPASQVHVFGDLAYRHDPFVHQTAAGLPMPGTHPFSQHSKGCSYYNGWRCGNGNFSNASQFGYLGADGFALPSGPLSPPWGTHHTMAVGQLRAMEEAERRKFASLLEGVEYDGGGADGSKSSRAGRQHSHKNSNGESRNASSSTSRSSRASRWWLRVRGKTDRTDSIDRHSSTATSGKSQEAVPRGEPGVMYTFGHADRVEFLAGAPQVHTNI